MIGSNLGNNGTGKDGTSEKQRENGTIKNRFIGTIGKKGLFLMKTIIFKYIIYNLLFIF